MADERTPNHPNYAEFNQASEEVTQRRPQEAQQAQDLEALRPPDQIRAPNWSRNPGRAAQEQSAIETINWKQGLKDRDFAQRMQDKLDQERANGRENEGPQHEDTTGRKH